MRRYADTFFRYWTIAIIPLIVFPLVALVMVKGTARKTIVSASVWADQVSLQRLGYSNPYNTPAQNMAASLGQLLQSQDFDLKAARESPIYWRSVARRPGAARLVVSDLAKNILVTDTGPNLVAVSYMGTNASAGADVLRSILAEAPNFIDQMNQAQTKGVSYYSAQVRRARARLTSAAAALGDYMKSNGIAPQNMSSESLFDPQFATLYEAVQSAQTDLQSADQQLAQMRAAATQSTFRVVDPPAYASTASRMKTAILDLAVALIAALLLSGGFVVLRTVLDRSLRYADEVPERLGLPVLAVVPQSQILSPKRASRSRLALVRGRRGA